MDGSGYFFNGSIHLKCHLISFLSDSIISKVSLLRSSKSCTIISSSNSSHGTVSKYLTDLRSIYPHRNIFSGTQKSSAVYFRQRKDLSQSHAFSPESEK